MQKTSLWRTLLLLLSLFVTNSQSTENYISEPLKLEEIRQKESLNNCRLKVSEEALYMCEDRFYIFRKDSSGHFSVLSRNEHTVIDADIFFQDVVYINGTKLMLLPSDSGQHHDHFVDIISETPIFVRIQEKEEYNSLIIFSQTKLDTPPAEPVANEYIIHNFLLGPAPHFHNTKLPTKNFRQNITISDFKDAIVFSDPVLGHDYLIIALKDGLIYFFRSLFEDPQLELVKTEQMDLGNEIKSITSRGNFLFVVLGNDADKKLTFKILRIVTPNDFSLIPECTIDLPGAYEERIEMQVKDVKNTFLIMINFPGSHLLVYNFQRSSQGIYKLQCPGEPEVINYGEAVSPAKIGYSFAYIFQDKNPESDKQGVLFSPFSGSEAKSSYFLPLCMPNYVLTNRGTCKPCAQGYSKGGHQSTCRPCSDLVVNSEMTMVSGIDPMLAVCPIKCKDPLKFGATCELDSQELYIESSLIPIADAQANFVNSTWVLECANGVFDASTGTCIYAVQEELAIKDNCAILTDCMNCSMSQSCSWCGGSCKNIKHCNTTSPMKVDLIDDFLTPAVHCNMSQVCGTEASQSFSGVFSFTEKTVYKNQVCKWYVEPDFNEQKIISLTIRNKNEVSPHWENHPNLFMSYCLHRRDSVLCSVSRMPTVSRRFTVSHAVFYLWAEESMIETSQNFEIEYDMAVIPGFVTEIMSFIAILIRLVFTCALFMCLANSYQRFVYYNRRRRLLREIDDLELGRFGEELDHDRELSQLNVEEVMQNNRVVSREVYNENENHDYGQIECSICLDVFHDQENLAKLSCKHVFHVNCFQDWVKSIASHNQVKCPVCNRVLA